MIVGQYKEVETGKDTSWITRADLNRARLDPTPYRDEFANSIGIHLHQDEFQRHLNEGIFFKANKEFYVLVADRLFYLIKRNSSMVLEIIHEYNSGY